MHPAIIEEAAFLVRIPAGSLYAKSWTPYEPTGYPIVLLHDSLGCTGLWRDLPNVLAGRFARKVVSYDRLGFGQSSARLQLPGKQFIQEEVEPLLAVMDAAGVEKAVLLGYSVGGSMALSAAAQAPERIAAVISESAQAFVEKRTLEGIAAAQARFASPEQVEKLRKWHGDKAEWILRAWFKVWTDPSYADWSLAPLLPIVKCPVIAIHGDRDDFGSIAFPEMIAHLAGGEAKMVFLENCGHMPHREQADRFLQEVGEFLERNP